MTSSTTGAGVVIAILGLLLLLFGGATYASCSSAVPSGASDCMPSLYLVGGGVLLLIVGILVAILAARSYTYIPPTSNPSIPPPLVTPVVIQQTVEHDIVKVRCRFCGTLGDPRSGRCAACGAPL
ncbi:MAG TPA: hypothetical protein VEY07_02620 [Thermoplasmata archaeon]|nr:hypothetical protein [Thermoplasmata archaeon]